MNVLARRRIACAALVALCAVVAPATATHAAEIASLELVRVVDLGGLTAFAARADDKALYVSEQAGRIRAIRNGRLVDRPLLDITAEISAGGERGLLGMAFSPEGSKLYVHYTNLDGDTRVDEYAMRRRSVDAGTRRTVLAVEQPQPNHNGGQLAFGPDGYLYIGLGDGGAGNDEGPGHARGGNGQSLETLLGKILRIDPTPSADSAYTVPGDNPFVGVDDARPEIWAFGLRNPWRFSFDARSGDLWIADVGQNEWEEVSFAPATNGRGAARGQNFGWNRLEGNEEFRGDPPDGAVMPVVTKSHDDGWASVIGGFVYRGTKIKALRGTYLFTDYYGGELLGLVPSGAGFDEVDLGITTVQVSSFGQGPDGEVYLLSQSDGLLRLQRA